MTPRKTKLLTEYAGLLQSPRRCLLLGAKGAGMVALAEILEDAGHHILRMDSQVSSGDAELRSAHNPAAPWCVNAIPDEVDICVASAAVPADDPVMQHVGGVRQCPVIRLHECLALLFSRHNQLCVAGTHGKSTTSAMLAGILDTQNYHPGFFVGATMPDLGRSGRFPVGLWAVLESCEFQQSFRHLQPQMAVLTGIERDHFDCFPTEQSEDNAFRNFVQKIPQDGTVVHSAACNRSRTAIQEVHCSTVSFAIHEELKAGQSPDWLATDIRQLGRTTTFVCHHPDGRETVKLQIPGRHNVKNSLAAMAAASRIGIPANESAAALSGFSGIARRFQIRGDYGGVTLVDDYAHHPSAIRETLTAVRESFPGQRILAVFEPHQILRTRALFSDFVASLTNADEVWLLPVFPARENATHLECCRLSGQLVKEVNRNGTKSFLFANLDQIASRIDHFGKPKDILLTMGAGRTNLIHDQLTRRLQRNSVA